MNRALKRNDGRQQKALGTLLKEAREGRGLSRAELSKLCRISQNSIVRYEKAGVDEDGQYPPSPKLAALCFYLNIPLEEAFWSCLSRQDFEEVAHDAVDLLVDHPAANYYEQQFTVLLKENRFLREAMKGLLGLNEELPYDEADRAWLLSELRKVINRQDDFESRMLQWGIFELNVKGRITPPKDAPDGWVHRADVSGQIESRDELPAKMFVRLARAELARAVDNIDRIYPDLAELETASIDNVLGYEKSPEDDLTVPSGPNPKPTPNANKEKEGG